MSDFLPVIDAIRFHPAGGKHFRAVLTLDASADPMQIQRLYEVLDGGNVPYRPTLAQDALALKVDHVANPDALVKTLHDAGMLADDSLAKHVRRREKAEEAKPKGVVEHVRHFINQRKLQTAALFYALGDMTGLTIGIINKDKGDLTWGVSTLTASTQMGIFGDKETHLSPAETLNAKMAEHVSRHGGMDYAENVKAALPEHIGQGVTGFMQDHAVYINNALFTVAGIGLLKAGINQDNVFKKISGSLVASSWGAATLVPQRGTEGLINWHAIAERTGISRMAESFSESSIGKALAGSSIVNAALYVPRRIGNWIYDNPRDIAGKFSIVHNINSFLGTTLYDLFRTRGIESKLDEKYGDNAAVHPHYREYSAKWWELDNAALKEHARIIEQGSYAVAESQEPRSLTDREMHILALVANTAGMQEGDSATLYYKSGRKGDADIAYVKSRGVLYEVATEGRLEKQAVLRPVQLGLEDTPAFRALETVEVRPLSHRLTAAQQQLLLDDIGDFQMARRLRRSAPLNAVMSGCYMAANALFAASGEKEKEKLDLSELYGDAAWQIIQQPQAHQQKALLEDIVAYYSERPEIRVLEVTPETLKHGIVTALQTMMDSGVVTGKYVIEEGNAITATQPSLASMGAGKEQDQHALLDDSAAAKSGAELNTVAGHLKVSTPEMMLPNS